MRPHGRRTTARALCRNRGPGASFPNDARANNISINSACLSINTILSTENGTINHMIDVFARYCYYEYHIVPVLTYMVISVLFYSFKSMLKILCKIVSYFNIRTSIDDVILVSEEQGYTWVPLKCTVSHFIL